MLMYECMGHVHVSHTCAGMHMCGMSHTCVEHVCYMHVTCMNSICHGHAHVWTSYVTCMHMYGTCLSHACTCVWTMYVTGMTYYMEDTYTLTITSVWNITRLEVQVGAELRRRSTKLLVYIIANLGLILASCKNNSPAPVYQESWLHHHNDD